MKNISVFDYTEVAEEFGQPLPSWFHIRQPKDKNYQSCQGISQSGRAY